MTDTTGHKWREWPEECCECGSECEVFTVSDSGAYDGDDVRCPECGQTGYVSGDEDGCHTVWHETELPELTEEERNVMNSFPEDAVSHWCNGEIWDGEKWIPQSLESELNKLMADYAWQKKKQRKIRNVEADQ